MTGGGGERGSGILEGDACQAIVSWRECMVDNGGGDLLVDGVSPEHLWPQCRQADRELGGEDGGEHDVGLLQGSLKALALPIVPGARGGGVIGGETIAPTATSEH